MNDSYLTEKKLGEYLKIIYPKNTFVYNKVFPNYKFRPDYRCDDLKIIVEFDGFQHYTKSKVIIDDYRKQEICECYGYRVIRIPYFIQMCNELLQYVFFKSNVNVDKEYPHGFIADNSTMIYPADFCELGLIRFQHDINHTFWFAKEEIINNLINRCKKYDKRMIIPNELDTEYFNIAKERINNANS